MIVLDTLALLSNEVLYSYLLSRNIFMHGADLGGLFWAKFGENVAELLLIPYNHMHKPY